MINKDYRYRPIEIVHDFNFIPCTYPQDAELPEPRQRLRRLKELGYGGVAISPRYSDYLSEESFAEASELISYAKDLGLTVWIYDEKFYPSGGACGRIARENPAYEAKAISVVTAEPDERGAIVINSPHGYGSAIAAFLFKTDEGGETLFDSITDISYSKTFGGGILYDAKGDKNLRAYAVFGRSAFEYCTTSHNTRGVRRYVDTLNPDAVKAFLEKTFGGYEKHISLGDMVEVVFTDEPQIPALCREEYRPDYRSDVLSMENEVFKVYDIPDEQCVFLPFLPWTERLPELFKTQHGYDLLPALPRIFDGEDEESGKVRRDFWRTVSDAFLKAYGRAYADFCKSLGIKYTGHMLYEESFAEHPYIHGDMLSQLGVMDIPGCDVLGSEAAHVLKFAAAIKAAASASMLYGKDDVMIEASNIIHSTFPISSTELKLATAMEVALGATRFASYYTELFMGDEAAKEFCEFSARLLSRLDGYAPRRDVWVYLPSDAFMEEAFPSYFINQRKALSQRLGDVLNFLGDLTREFSAHGVDFVFVNEERLDALKDLRREKILVIPKGVEPQVTLDGFAQIIKSGDAKEAAEELASKGYASISTDATTLLSLKKENTEATVFLLVNFGDEAVEDVKLNAKDGEMTIYDPETNAVQESLAIPPRSCRIVRVMKQ